MTKKLLIVIGALAATGAAIAVAVLALVPGESALAQAAGRYDGQSMRAQMRMKMVEEGEQITMVGTITSNADGTRAYVDAKTTVDGETFAQKIVTVDKKIWMEMPELEAIMPEGKRWIHLGEENEFVGKVPASEYIAILEKSESITERRTKLDGRPVTLYAGKVSAREVAEAAGGQIEAAYRRAAGNRDVLVPLAAWVADGGKLERLRVTFQGNEITFDDLEYGVRADIAAPGPDETIEEADWERALEEQTTTG
jgi:hypothetical protein